MVKKPSELINGSVPPSQNVPQQTTSGGSSNWLSTLIVLLLAGWLFYSIASRYDRGDDRKQDDRHEQKDDDKKQDDKKQDEKEEKQTLNLKQHALVVIRNKKTLNDDIEYTITMQDDEFWGWAKAELADVEILEASDDLAVKLLTTIADKPPVVALINTQNQKVAWSMPLPKGSTDSIRSKLK